MKIDRPQVKREKSFTYTDKTQGKARQFTPVADEAVATFDPEESADVATALRRHEKASADALAAGRGFAIIRLPEAEADASEVADELTASTPVANILPVMQDDEGNRRYFLPDELTVQFTEKVTAEKAEGILASLGMNIVVRQRTPGYYTVSVPEGKGLFESIQALSRLDEVAFAEPSEVGLNNLLEVRSRRESKVPAVLPADGAEELLDPSVVDQIVRGLERQLEEVTYPAPSATADNRASDALDTSIPADPSFGVLWGLHNTGQTINGITGTADADIDAPHAWPLETGSRRIVAAVIDTGMDLDHPDLAANLLPRGSEDWDFADAADGEPWDSGSHGTHVAGTIAARRNALGVVGVAPDIYLMPLRVNLTTGMNQNRADAINYVAQQAVNFSATRRYVINCSWRMNGDHAGVRTAIQNAVAKNVVVVFAAGNDGVNTDVSPQYPGVYPEVIAVAATDQKDQRASFSNYGANVDVSAPGVNIYSTVPDNTYGYMDGTSMASPHTAGVAALVWSRNPALTNAQVRAFVQDTCDNIDAQNPGFVGKLGRGRINAYRAVRAVPPPLLPATLLRRFPFAQPNAGSSTGLAFIPSFPFPGAGRRPTLLFITQQAGSERIYFLDPVTGAVLHSIDPVLNDTIGSLAWDGTEIRVANVTTGAGSINRINPFTGAQTGSIPAPAGRGEGLEVMGTRIFYSTITHIHELRASDGFVFRSFPALGGACHGLAAGLGYVFAANSITGVITVFTPLTLDVKGIIRAPGVGGRRAEGLAFDPAQRILYVANQSENTIYALRVTL